MGKLIIAIILLLLIYAIAVCVVSLVTSKPLRTSCRIVLSFLFPATEKTQQNVRLIIDEIFEMRFDEIVLRNSALKTVIYNKRELQLENGTYGFEIEFFGTVRSANICIEELKNLIRSHFWVQSFQVYCVGEIIDLQRDNEYRLRILYAVGERMPLLRAYEEKTNKIKANRERKKAQNAMQLEKPIGTVSLGNKNEA